MTPNLVPTLWVVRDTSRIITAVLGMTSTTAAGVFKFLAPPKTQQGWAPCLPTPWFTAASYSKILEPRVLLRTPAPWRHVPIGELGGT